MSGPQEFTPEQLERIESAVNFAIAFTDHLRTTGTVVKDILRTQDLTNTRSGSIVSLKRTPSIGFFHLPAEIRNQIYRYCLVVWQCVPKTKAGRR
jgi:hypothetical protein